MKNFESTLPEGKKTRQILAFSEPNQLHSYSSVHESQYMPILLTIIQLILFFLSKEQGGTYRCTKNMQTLRVSGDACYAPSTSFNGKKKNSCRKDDITRRQIIANHIILSIC